METLRTRQTRAFSLLLIVTMQTLVRAFLPVRVINCKPQSFTLLWSNAAFSTSASATFTKLDENDSRVQLVFDLQLPQGRCVGLELQQDLPSDHPDSIQNIHSNNHWLFQFLHPDEIKYGQTISSPAARQCFLLGRLALRTALPEPYPHAILKDAHGRPLVPEGYVGSISHKGRTGVALVARQQETPISVGVDLERADQNRANVASKILTANEQASLGNLAVRLKYDSYNCVKKSVLFRVSQRW